MSSPDRFHPAHRWIIPAEPGICSRFWAINVYHNLDDMNGQIRFLYRRMRLDSRARYGAACVGYNIREYPEFLGFVVFAKDLLGEGVVAHEMLHAASQSLGYKDKPLTRRREEVLATRTQFLVGEFWKKWYRYVD